MENLFLNRYPYTDFHELNLSWIIEMLSQVEKTLNDFVSINALKYADPLQWDITRQYEKNTVVIDPVTGTAYISVAPVPAGVALTRTEYWTVVFDLQSFVTKANKNFTNHYEDATTLTATFASAANDWLVWGDVLYKVLINITAGDAYVVDSNIRHFTIEDYIGHLDDLVPAIANRNSIITVLNELQAHIDYVDERIGEFNNLVPSLVDRTSVVTLLNELQTHIDAVGGVIGNFNDLAPSLVDRTSVVTLLNELQTHIDAIGGVIGNLNDLSPSITDRANVVAATNNVQSHVDTVANRIGDLTTLKTENKTSAVNAINECVDSLDVLQYYKNKKILIVGDSVSDENVSALQPNWVANFKSRLAGIASAIDNNSVSGRKMTELETTLINIADLGQYDIIYIMLGVNDFGNNIPLGDFHETGTFNNAIRLGFEKIINASVGREHLPDIYFISPLYRNNTSLNTLGAPLYYYRAAIMAFCKLWNCYYIDGANITLQNGLINLLDTYYVDDIHPAPLFAPYITDYVIRMTACKGDKIGSWVGKLITYYDAYIDTSVFTSGHIYAYIDADNFLHIRARGHIANPTGMHILTSAIPCLAVTYNIDSWDDATGIPAGYVVKGFCFTQAGDIRVNFQGNAIGSGDTWVQFDLKLSPKWLYNERFE